MPRLYEHQGKRLLAEAGIDIPEGRVITRSEEIPEALSEIGLPVHPSVSSRHLFYRGGINVEGKPLPENYSSHYPEGWLCKFSQG